MLTKTKQNRKNLKIENSEKRKKNGLEIWWRGSYPENLVCIHAAVSEKPEFADDGRTDDGRHDSSSVDKVKQS